MSPSERIPGFLVCRHGESRGAEPLEIVTRIAGCTRRPISKLTKMMICMTIGTLLESSQGDRQSVGMAPFTPCSLVSTDQGKTCPCVIEALETNGFPSLLRMALLTCRAQASLVGIPVAIGAVGKG